MKLSKMFLELAIDTEQPAAESVTEGANIGTNQEQTEGSAETPEGEQIPTEYDIDGEKYTLEQIREWKQGNLRQQDYTKKTQEIAQIRKESQEAMEVYNYLKANPEIAKKLSETETPEGVRQVAVNVSNPMNSQLQQLNTQVMTMQINADLAEITSKDKSVSDLELLKIATEKNVDVKTAYTFWKGLNVDKILNERLANQSKELTDKIKNNKTATKTIIKAGDKNTSSNEVELTDQQLEYAKKLNMTPKEYKEWM